MTKIFLNFFRVFAVTQSTQNSTVSSPIAMIIKEGNNITKNIITNNKKVTKTYQLFLISCPPSRPPKNRCETIITDISFFLEYTWKHRIISGFLQHFSQRSSITSKECRSAVSKNLTSGKSFMYSTLISSNFWSQSTGGSNRWYG